MNGRILCLNVVECFGIIWDILHHVNIHWGWKSSWKKWVSLRFKAVDFSHSRRGEWDGEDESTWDLPVLIDFTGIPNCCLMSTFWKAGIELCSSFLHWKYIYLNHSEKQKSSETTLFIFSPKKRMIFFIFFKK